MTYKDILSRLEENSVRIPEDAELKRFEQIYLKGGKVTRFVFVFFKGKVEYKIYFDTSNATEKKSSEK